MLQVTQLVTQRKRREDGLVLSGQQPSEESVTKEELPLPVAEHDVGGESSPSPVASPFHIKHPIQQQVETSDTPQPHSSLAVQKPSTQGVGVADQKRLCLSTQVRTADEIEQDYIYVYSDEDIRSWVCLCVQT